MGSLKDLLIQAVDAGETNEFLSLFENKDKSLVAKLLLDLKALNERTFKKGAVDEGVQDTRS